MTASGAFRPIKWLGHRNIDCRSHPDPYAVMPLRIAAHALASNRPARDLFVSPGHSICIDMLGEVLIPASSLVNGTTIIQEDVDSVTYWHVELDTHDIILAENLPCESYLDMGNRGFFAENDALDFHAVRTCRQPLTPTSAVPFTLTARSSPSCASALLRERAPTAGVWRRRRSPACTSWPMAAALIRRTRSLRPLSGCRRGERGVAHIGYQRAGSRRPRRRSANTRRVR